MATQETTTPERWLSIPGFPDYSVSDLGRIRHDRSHSNFSWNRRILSLNGCRKYLHVDLWNERIEHHRPIHALVLLTFVGPRPSGLQINHRNGDKHDNRLENLHYCTASENVQHAIKHLGRNERIARGEDVGTSKLTIRQVCAIRREYAKGKTTHRALGRKYSVHHSQVGRIIRRQWWKHVH